MERWKEGQQAGRLTDRQMDIWKEYQAGRQTDRQTDLYYILMTLPIA